MESTGAAHEARASPVDDVVAIQERARESEIGSTTEQVVQIPLDCLIPFKNHPFKVQDDDDLMQDTIDSISAVGVVNPIIVRPAKDGKYEIISGHRRVRASELVGKHDIKAIVRQMDDDAAVITLVDSNLQRENILPSERAKAYKMKMEALRHQGQRSDLTSSQVGTKLRADEVLAKDSGTSRSQVQRYIRLANLTPKLMEMVDNKEIAFNPAVELSYLKPEEQENFLSAMDYGQTTPSLSQAQRIKQLSQAGECTLEAMCDIMDEEKKSPLDNLTIKSDVLRKFFPRSYTPLQMQQTIIKLLEAWQKKRARDHER